MNTSSITLSETSPAKRRFRKLRFAFITLAAFALTVAIFYAEENWRGKRAWENCKREYEAKGFVLDWDKLIPPPVPDAQNFFKAPNMSEWFIRGYGHSNKLPATQPSTNELAERLKPENLLRWASNNPVVLAELTYLPIGVKTSEDADLVLRCSSSDPALFLSDSFSEGNVPPVSQEKPDTNDVIPTIQFQDVPITTAIETLERQGGLGNSKIAYDVRDKSGKVKPEPTVTIKWNGITAHEALKALLDNYGLRLIHNSNEGIALVTLNNPDAPMIYASPDLRGKIKQLFQNIAGPYADGARGDTFLEKSRAEIKPARVILHCGVYPGDREIIALFGQFYTNDTAQVISPKLHVEHTGANSARIIFTAYPAADYLAWSDQLQPDFNLIHEALKRPYARIDCDYQLPTEIGIPNFITLRSLVQTLAQRAQCHFMLNQPEQALEDLTRMHETRLILEGAPTHKPMTLVSAMINVAVAGVYSEIVAQGMRRHVWQEPQLAVLQKQLAEKKITPFVLAALRTEPVAFCRDVRMLPVYKVFDWNATNVSIMRKALWSLWPRGWTYQNIANITALELKPLEAFDPVHNTISPGVIEGQAHNVEKFVGHGKSPYKLIAAVGIPNFSKAWQTTARNQTLVNEAQIACALERYRLAHGEYPETLDALVPQFIEKLPHDIIGGQPLRYRRTDDGKFLLYSIGWNEKDDGGEKHQYNNVGRGVDYSQGDWVWQN